MRNFLRQLEKYDSRITLSRLQQIDEFYRTVAEQLDAVKGVPDANAALQFPVNFDELYKVIFQNADGVMRTLEQEMSTVEKQGDLDLINKLKSVYGKMEDYKSWESLSLQDLIFFQEHVELIHSLPHSKPA